MKIESIATIKKELNHLPKEELLELCLRLGKFKQENKALLTYLLFEAHDEDGYISNVKNALDEFFNEINTGNYFYMKKTIRAILRKIRIYIKYSKKTATEVELLLYFCEQLNTLQPSIHKSIALGKLYERQKLAIKKKIATLHEDLQYDYNIRLKDL